jgi:hypothetical protein
MTKEEQKALQFMIDEIFENMKEDDFQRDFFESLSTQYTQRESLSAKQVACIEKIYERVTR